MRFPLQILAHNVPLKYLCTLSNLLIIAGIPHRFVNRWNGNTVRVYLGSLNSSHAKKADIAILYDPTFTIDSLNKEEIGVLQSSDNGARCIEWVGKAACINIHVVDIAYYLLYVQAFLGEDTAQLEPVPLKCPLVDRIALFFKNLVLSLFPELKSLVVPPWPNERLFAACLTHDIDILTWGTLENARRRFRMAFSKGFASLHRAKHLALGFEEIIRGLAGRYRINCELDLSSWLSIESLKGVKACYYFAHTLHRDVNDTIYSYEDYVLFGGQKITVQNVIGILSSAGAEIGLHASIASSKNPKLIKKEKKLLEGVLGGPVFGVRQHYLRMRYPQTLAAQCSAGFFYDATIGYNRHIGFKAGTSFPYNVACGSRSKIFTALVEVIPAKRVLCPVALSPATRPCLLAVVPSGSQVGLFTTRHLASAQSPAA